VLVDASSGVHVFIIQKGPVVKSRLLMSVMGKSQIKSNHDVNQEKIPIQKK